MTLPVKRIRCSSILSLILSFVPLLEMWFFSFLILGFIANPVIEPISRLELAAPSLESIPNSPGGAGWSWVGCGCHKVPISDQILILPSSAHRWY